MERITAPALDGAFYVDTTASLNGILDNVVWIVGHLDDRGLDEIRDVPVLELAKHISLASEHGDDG